jgi:hypothetical protein
MGWRSWGFEDSAPATQTSQHYKFLRVKFLRVKVSGVILPDSCSCGKLPNAISVELAANNRHHENFT